MTRNVKVTKKTGAEESAPDDAVRRRLRIFLELRGRSVPEFADETGIPASTLHHHLTGRSVPGGGHLIRMAAAGLDVDWLLTGRLRVGAPSLLAELDESESVVGADRQLLELLELEACKAADAYMERRRARGGEALTTRQTLRVFDYYLQIMVKMIGNKWPIPSVSRLRSIGIGTVVDMSKIIKPSDLDPAIDKLVLAASGGADA